jgi:DNA-binding response OmpR family regulator
VATQRVLIVDDDPTIAEVLTLYLEREGFRVENISDGSEAVRSARENMPDLILLDLMLPGIGGLEVCRQLRTESSVPIIMLSARGSESDFVVGLKFGADDYVSKPFSPREVTSRVKAVLRRSSGVLAHGNLAVPERIVDGDLAVDFASHTVNRAGQELVLTAREFEVLAFLVRQPGRVFRREELMQSVWGYAVGDTSTVTVHIRRLREKIEDDASNPVFIQTVWGVGYRWRGEWGG